MTDDRAAIDRCHSGDPDGFRPLVERYQRQAIGHALLFLGHREDASDAVQEAFVDAYRALHQFDPTRPFYPWFYVILRNRCFKMLGQRTKQPEPISLNDSKHSEIIRSRNATGSMSLINDALMELDVKDREIILLKHVDGLTYDELAARLDIPVGTVMSRLYRARQRLREKLDS